MFRNLILTGLCIFISLCAAAQTPSASTNSPPSETLGAVAPVPSTSPVALAVERSSYSPGLFGGKWSSLQAATINLVRKNDHQFFYKSPESLQLFDQSGFAFTNPLPNENFDIAQSTDRSDYSWSVGNKWKTSFTSPMMKGSRCTADTLVTDFAMQITGEKMLMLRVNGRDQEVKTVQLVADGLWKLPPVCNSASGKVTGAITYAPELNVLVSAETITYWGNTQIAGSRMTLVDIKK